MGMKVVGVLQLAPDAGLRGSRLGDSAGFDPQEAVDRGRRLIAEGADIVEVCDGSGEGFAVLNADDAESVIAPPSSVVSGRSSAASSGALIAPGRSAAASSGGDSSVAAVPFRPPSDSRLEDSRSEQVLEVIAALSEEARVSISTISPRAALSAVEAGASIIRDTSGSLLETASLCGAGWVAVHSGSGRETLANRGILEEVSDCMCGLAEQASRSGIAEFYFDPGFGVGKSFEESFDLLAGLEMLTERCSSVLVDVDCRGFAAALLRRLSALPPGSEAVSVEGALSQTGRGELDMGKDGALAVAAWAISAGVAALRCREVAAAVDVARTFGVKPPAPLQSVSSPPAPSQSVFPQSAPLPPAPSQSVFPQSAPLPPAPLPLVPSPSPPQPAPFQSSPQSSASFAPAERRGAPASRLEAAGR